MYIETLKEQIRNREISFPKAVDFLVEHGIHELRAIRLLSEGAK